MLQFILNIGLVSTGNWSTQPWSYRLWIRRPVDRSARKLPTKAGEVGEYKVLQVRGSFDLKVAP